MNPLIHFLLGQASINFTINTIILGETMCAGGHYNGETAVIPPGVLLPTGEVLVAEVVVTAPTSGGLGYQGEWWFTSLVPAAAGLIANYGFGLLGGGPGVVGGLVVGFGTQYVLTYDLNESNEESAGHYASAFGSYNPYNDPNPHIQ